jgi:hypothetical protein
MIDFKDLRSDDQVSIETRKGKPVLVNVRGNVIHNVPEHYFTGRPPPPPAPPQYVARTNERNPDKASFGLPQNIE